MSTPTNTPPPPRVWIRCLAAYCTGKRHGAWVDATQDADAIADAIKVILDSSPSADMLASSPSAKADRYDISDYDACYGMRPRSTSAEHIAELGSFIAEHGELGARVANHFNNDIDQAADVLAFNHCYRSEYRSLADLAADVMPEAYGLADWVLAYFDFERYARDLQLGRDFFFVVLSNGKVAVFWI